MAREQFVRSEDYRSRYIAEHPGWHGQWYMCPYCGRFVKKDRMQVDHIISIDQQRKEPDGGVRKMQSEKIEPGWLVDRARKAGTRLVCRRMGFADSVDSGRSDSNPLRGADSARGAGMAGNGDHKTGFCRAPVR